MDISRDELRREVRDLQRLEREATRARRELLARATDPTGGLDARTRRAVLGGGLSRRRFLAVGGIGVATAAVLAACGADEDTGIPQTGEPPTIPELETYPTTDAALLRTASSLEHLVVDAYGALVGLGVLPAAQADILELFADQHREHAAAIEAATVDVGAEPYAEANPVLYTKVIEPAFLALAAGGNNPDEIITLAWGLETFAAESYQLLTPSLGVALRQAAMSIGAVEAAHAAVLSKFVPGSTVLGGVAALEEADAAAATTTTAEAGVQVEASAVPGPFQSLTPVEVVLNGEPVSIDLPGPASFMYEELE